MSTYGSNIETVPLVNTNISSLTTGVVIDIDPLNPFNEDYKVRENFWEQVIECFERENKKNPEVTWIKVETRLRLELLKKRYAETNKENDILVILMTTEYEKFKSFVTENNELEMLDSFVSQLTDFADILLQEDFDGSPIFPLTKGDSENKVVVPESYKPVYKELIKCENGSELKTTILHLAAENNFYEIARKYLLLYPNSVCRKDFPQKSNPRRIPVEIALDRKHDKICSLLMKSMLNERVRDLFANESVSSPGKYSLGELIKIGTMKETVLAVLDSCINPDFPYIIRDEQQIKKEEEAWSKMPQMPLRFNFYFRILDGDSEGRPAKIFKNGNKQGVLNQDFKHFTKSPLYVISNYANLDDSLDPIRHPLVRQLVRQKWNNYGSYFMRVRFIMYLVFLLIMSLAFILYASTKNPFNSVSQVDKFRVFCQVTILLFTIVYLISAVVELVKDPLVYLKAYYNVINFIGLLLIMVLVLLHFYSNPSITRAVGSVAYFLNFIRVFEYFLTSETYGVYTKTFARIVYTDITKFSVVFCVVLFAFAGSIFMAISASSAFDVNNTKTYWSVLLKGIRAISEGKEFADDYSGYHILLLFLILGNMFTIIVIMANILIGQLSYRFEMAQTDAAMQLDIDKAKMITQMERSWFKLLNYRIKYYKDGIFVSRAEMFKDLLQDWDILQAEGDDKTKGVIQNMVEKRILKK